MHSTGTKLTRDSQGHLCLRLPDYIKKAGFKDGEPLHLMLDKTKDGRRTFDVMGSMGQGVLHVKGLMSKY